MMDESRGTATEPGGAENEKNDILPSATLRCWLQPCYSVGGMKTIWSYNTLLLRPDNLFRSFKCDWWHTDSRRGMILK